MISAGNMMRRRTDPKGLGSMNWGLFWVLQKGSPHQKGNAGSPEL